MHTKESQENKVDIPDASVDVMKDFLLFIYTGVTPEGDRLSLELLTLADKVNRFILITLFNTNVFSVPS